jgi:2-amino-4-hydroxy-6-hydroxymethyldihydropteridine diphosphokinase
VTESVEARAWVALGSNLDDPAGQVQHALSALGEFPRTRLLRHSRLYRSAPWGMTEQPAFINAVAELATTLPPRQLLDALLATERAQGRRRDGQRWGPRTLDLDLLTYADVRSDAPDLVLPHPHIAERAFVLVPLAELDADLEIPGVGLVRDLLGRVDAGDCIPIA